MRGFRGVKVYKPLDKGGGSAFQFSRGVKRSRGEDPVLMIEATNQSGPKPAPGSTESPFDWSNKIVMMFNRDECGEIAAYIVNMQRAERVIQRGIELIHDTERDDGQNISKLTLKKPDTDNKWGNWGITMKRGDTFCKMFLTAGEVYQLKVLCDSVIESYVNTEVNFGGRTQGTQNKRDGDGPF